MADTPTFEDREAIQWLLSQDNPGLRYWTLRDLLGMSENDSEVVSARNAIPSWSPIADYLREQHPDGYWGFLEDLYWPKWTASVWALILLAELGMPGTHPSIRSGCEHFLKTIGEQDRSWPPANYSDDDLRGWRLCWEPCVTGNMARTLAVFGYGEDQRVREMFEWLIKCQEEDGGWNCETEYSRQGEPIHHSSFMSTIEPLWAFSSLPRQHWPKGGKESVERAVEFLLVHRLFKSDKTGKIIRHEWTQLHFPMFYFYDILHASRVVSTLGYASDERMNDAIKLLRSKRMTDGKWPLEATFLRAVRTNFVPDSVHGNWHQEVDSNVDAPNVDASNLYSIGGKVAQIPQIYESLGKPSSASPWITLNALRVFKNLD